MEPIRKQYEDEIEKRQKHYEDEMENRQNSSDILIEIMQMTDIITKGNKDMCEVFKDRPNKLVKAAKVPSWSKDKK